MATHRMLAALTQERVPLNRTAYLLLILRCSDRFHSAPALTASSPGPAIAGISVSAIAASFNQPFETARRHANELIRQGLGVRQGVRISVDRRHLGSPRFKQYLAELHDIMVHFVRQLRDAGIELPTGKAGHPYDQSKTIAAALDLALAAYEYGTPFFATWLEMRVMCALVCGNARALAIDPALSRLYGGPDAVPPDDLLLPVSSRALARVLNISEATARRQLRVLLDRGLVRRMGDGVIRTEKALETPALRIMPGRASISGLRTIKRLHAGGFRFDDPAALYIGGEPPLVDFG